MKRTLSLLVALVCAVGCNKVDDPRRATYRTFVYEYGQAIALDIEGKKTGRGTISENIPAQGLLLSVDHWKPFWNSNATEFWDLAERYGDTAYNHMKGLESTYETRACCFAEPFASFHVTSDATWDDAHPAGTPLDDILWFEGKSVAAYIQSGYTADQQYVTISKKLTEVTEEDTKLLVATSWNGLNRSVIRFMTTPVYARRHTLTVTWTTSGGETGQARVVCSPVASEIW